MKIWIDFINSPQVSFFEPLILDFTKAGHNFILTCRDSANTVELIKQRNWKHVIIGNRAEKGTIKKIFSFPIRVKLLRNLLKGEDIDVAICQSSFYLPLTAQLLGIPSIYTNDNEHALGNIPAFLFATRIFIPENLSLEKVYKRGAKKNKVLQYPGIKEGIYLWPKGADIQKKRDGNILKNQIFLRPEPSTAQYYSGKLNFLDSFLAEIKDEYPVTILVRDSIQYKHYSQAKFSGISIPMEPMSFEEVAISCRVFIGAGGSMTREMAIMGIPTISVYQGELLEVDKFLITEKLMIHHPNLKFTEFRNLISGQAAGSINSNLIAKGREAYNLFKLELLKYNK